MRSFEVDLTFVGFLG